MKTEIQNLTNGQFINGIWVVNIDFDQKAYYNSILNKLMGSKPSYKDLHGTNGVYRKAGIRKGFLHPSQYDELNKQVDIYIKNKRND